MAVTKTGNLGVRFTLDTSEVSNALSKLSEGLMKDTVARALRKASAIVKTEFSSAAPVETGALRDSFAYLVKRYKTKGVGIIGPDKKAEKNGRRPVRYAHLVEKGHKIVVNGQEVGFVPGKYFMRNALEACRNRAMEAMESSFAEDINRIGRVS